MDSRTLVCSGPQLNEPAPAPKGQAVPLPRSGRRLKVVAATVRTAMRSGEGSERRNLSSTATLSARALERDADRRSGRTKVL